MTCKCNCHDPFYREANDIQEHANCMECAFEIAEEVYRMTGIETWLNDFVESGGQRPFRSTKHD